MCGASVVRLVFIVENKTIAQPGLTLNYKLLFFKKILKNLGLRRKIYLVNSVGYQEDGF